MTTGNLSFYGPPNPDIGVIACKRQLTDRGNGKLAVIDLGPAGRLYLHEPARARELLAAAVAALQILDPDGAVIIRAGNQEIHTVAEILPGPEQTDPWMEEDPPKPAPALVIPAAAQETGLPSCYRCGAYENSAPLRETTFGSGSGYWVCRDLKACGERIRAAEAAKAQQDAAPELVIPPAAKHCADCGAAGPLDGEGVCQDFAGCAERQTGLARKTAGGAR